LSDDGRGCFEHAAVGSATGLNFEWLRIRAAISSSSSITCLLLRGGPYGRVESHPFARGCAEIIRIDLDLTDLIDRSDLVVAVDLVVAFATL